MKNIDIIGAGIGGLTTALFLEKKGFKVTIYEQAESLKPVGAGILLASNAMLIYKNLGIEKELKSVGIPVNVLNITDKMLKPISKIDLGYFMSEYNLQNIAIHRGELQKILLNNLKATNIKLGYKLESVEKTKNTCKFIFANGEVITSSLTIGADGIHSTLRKSIAPQSKIRGTNQMCWRGILKYDLPLKYRNELNEAWGEANRFAFVECGNNSVYWYAVKTIKESSSKISTEDLINDFKTYNPIVNDIISKTKKSAIHTSKIQDLKPIKKWYTSNICLIGDAAHAATPNMGQGACQAIEDAYAITKYIDPEFIEIGFKKFQKSRITKAHHVVKQSRYIGKISHWENSLAIYIRNTFLRLLPERLNINQLENLFELKSKMK